MLHLEASRGNGLKTLQRLSFSLETMVRRVIRSPPQNAIDDVAIREMIKSFHQNNLPDVPDPVKQTAKGKQKKK